MSNKKIFVSQSELENGRNRSERRLNAILDNQQNPSSRSDTKHSFQIVGTGGASSIFSHSIPQTSPVYSCEHESYCTSPHKFSMKCNFSQDCRIKKFYDKWGENGNQLGMGS